MKTKRVLATYQLNQIQAMSECFTKMAARGWLLKEINAIYYVFEKGEPTNTRRYTVDVFEKASAYSVAPSDEQQEYIEYCKSAGWDYVDSNGRFIVFSTDDTDAVEIQSDMSIKLGRIHKGMMRNCVWPGIFVMITYGLLLATTMKDNIMETYPLMLLALVGFLLYLIVEYLVWYLRSRRYVKAYNTFAPDNHLRVTIVQWVSLIAILSLLVREVLTMGFGTAKYLVLIMVVVEILSIWGAFVLGKKIGAALKTPGWVNFIINFVLVFLVMMVVMAVMTAGLMGNLIQGSTGEHEVGKYIYIAEDGETVRTQRYQDLIPVDMDFLGILDTEDLVMSTYGDSESTTINDMTFYDFWENECEDEYRDKERYPRLAYTLFTAFDTQANVRDYCMGTSEDEELQTKELPVDLLDEKGQPYSMETAYGVDSIIYRHYDDYYDYLIVNGDRALYVSTTQNIQLNREQLRIMIDCVLNNTSDYK